MDPMTAEERRAQLRAAICSRDDQAVIALLRTRPWPQNALQLIGDAIIATLSQHTDDDTAGLARDCVIELRGRGWAGDDELADQLDARLGTGAARSLRPLPVDLEELAMVLEGDPLSGRGRLDITTGEVWPAVVIEYSRDLGDDDVDDDPDRWLSIDNLGSRSGYRDMQEFIGTIGDPDRADRLEIAIEGRGAFHRFKNTLARWPAELQRWHDFSDERQRGRARAWLAEEGYHPMPPS